MIMKSFKVSYFVITLLVLFGLLASVLSLAEPVQAQTDSRYERLNDPNVRLYVWQLEREGIKITKEDRLYRVVNADTLASIADRYGITVDHLLTVNPQIGTTTMLLRGELLHIPSGITETSPPFYFTPEVVYSLPAAGTGGVVGQSVGQATLTPTTGARLFLWQLERDGIKITKEDRLYRVVNGDTLYKIAVLYGLTLEKLIAANPQINDLSVILRGELIRIPDGITETSPPFYASPQPVSK
jgi:LysM repeat protein